MMASGILDPKGLHKNPMNDAPYSEEYKKQAEIWSKFPTYKKANDVIKMIKGAVDVLLIVSGTGSGKTVLIPKFVLHALDYGGKGRVAVTLPKRVVTLSAAEFAAKTLDVSLGKEIGYIYKDAPKGSVSSETKMIYMTDGSLISIIDRDPLLSEYGAVVIDEAHERKTQIDLLLLLLKKIVLERKKKNPLKLIIMSATIDPTIFMRYFSTNGCKTELLEISGVPNYPVEIIYSKHLFSDYLTEGVKIIKEIIKKKEDILFFVTSGAEAKKACRMLKEQGMDNVCVAVYSEMNDEEKQQMKTKAQSVKVYIATNVAESSITLDGISYVVDAGLELSSSYDYKRRAQTLTKKLITKAQASQRSGRVGRTKPGTCYRLYTKEQFDSFESFPLPEIKKSDLTNDFLRLINYVKPNTFAKLTELLNELIDPPSTDVLDSIYKTFKHLKIINEKNELTKLGINLLNYASLPIEVGVSLLLSYDYKCGYHFSLLVSLMEAVDYDFKNVYYDKERGRTKFAHPSGDHITILMIHEKISAETNKEEFCKKNNLNMKVFLNKKILDTARKYFFKLKDLNQKGGGEDTLNVEAILRVLSIGMQTNIAKLDKKVARTVYPMTECRASIPGSSTMNSSKCSIIVFQELFINNSKAEIKFVSCIDEDLIKSMK